MSADAVVAGVRISHPEKQLWPEVGLTKRDLATYFEAVAPRLLPHLANRPLSIKRYPQSVEGPGFFQKDLPDHAPASVGRHREWAHSAGREVAYALVSDVSALVWFAQQNAIELHPAVFRIDRPDRVDQLTFDLDPAPDQGMDAAVAAAGWVREVLTELGLNPLVKTSGKRGLHLVVPIERRYDGGLVRALGLAIARMVADRHPDDLTVQMRKADRGGRLLLDWSRNGIGTTVIAAWSPRAQPAGTVSMPLQWGEVDDALDPAAFTITTALERPDHWDGAWSATRLESAVATVQAAGYELEDQSPRARTRP